MPKLENPTREVWSAEYGWPSASKPFLFTTKIAWEMSQCKALEGIIVGMRNLYGREMKYDDR